MLDSRPFAPSGEHVPTAISRTLRLDPMDAQFDEDAMFVDISARDPDVKLRTMKVERWGRLWAPETFTEFVRVVQRTTWATGRPEAWRGQSRVWPLHSGATRRFQDSPIFAPARTDRAKLEAYVSDYERELVNHARLDGHGEIAGRHRSDLELLGLLQHHGAATRFVDFRLNAFIALWFACRGHPEGSGLVVGCDLTAAREMRRQELIDKPIEEHQGAGLCWWRPWGLSPRMPARASLLVWSQVLMLPWGSVGYAHGEAPQFEDDSQRSTSEPSEIGAGLVAIAVSPDLKADMEDRWEPILGYTERSLFPDLDGFARFNAAGRPFEPSFFSL
jgi:hypothetical protein